MTWQARTESVLSAVLRERGAQVARYGHNHDLEDGTGPGAPWLLPISLYRADSIEHALRGDYVNHEKIHGKPTWMHLVREEVAEAFKEQDPERLEEELIQVAALCVSWVETIQERRGDPVARFLEDLPLDQRVRNLLHRNGIHTVSQLCRQSWLDLYSLRNFGPSAADHLREVLRAEGLSLKES
jgi:malonyl CoA-acyl carrier protein transacylase